MKEQKNSDLANLRHSNITRQLEWNTGSEKLSLAYKGNELAGEVGELCNVLKKLERERIGIKGSRATKEQAEDEIADVIICADLIAEDLNINLATAVRNKFNKTSIKYGFNTMFTNQSEQNDGDKLIAQLLLFCEKDGTVVNGFKVKEIIDEMRNYNFKTNVK